jgi:hypothetical protein
MYGQYAARSKELKMGLLSVRDCPSPVVIGTATGETTAAGGTKAAMLPGRLTWVRRADAEKLPRGQQQIRINENLRPVGRIPQSERLAIGVAHRR